MFLPEAHRGALLDQRMRDSLADTLEHVFDAVGASLGLEDIDMKGVSAGIRAHRISPGVFGRYYDLVPAIKAGRLEEAKSLFREIVALSGQTPHFRVLPLSESALGADAARYAKFLTGERVENQSFGPPTETDWQGYEAKAAEAFRMIEAVDPVLAEEIRGITVQLVGAIPCQEGHDFGSASSFMLWGAVVANLRYQKSLPDVVGALVHEAAHLLLFGLSIDEPLVLNPVKERYASPLRKDPRPMDGIYHATFVTARLYYFFSQFRDVYPDAFASSYDIPIDDYLRNLSRGFQGGRETIVRFGRLSEAGQQIVANTSEYMKHAA